MTTSVRFCLSYDLPKEFLLPLKWKLFPGKMHCCHERCHDVTFSRGNVMKRVVITLFIK